MKQRRLVSAIFILSLACATLFAADSFPAADSVKAKMTGQSLVYYVTRIPPPAMPMWESSTCRAWLSSRSCPLADPDNVEFHRGVPGQEGL